LLAVALNGEADCFAQGPIPNSLRIPTRVLSARIDLTSPVISAESRQLAAQLGLTERFLQLKEMKNKLRESSSDAKESGALQDEIRQIKQDLTEAITQASLEVDFVEANINEEIYLYGDMLAAMSAERDRKVAIYNAASFVSNGAFWAAAEGIDIPTYRTPVLSIPSGTLGIIAGVIPSFASLYAMKEFSGKRYSAKEDPNMLAKLFNRSTNPENAYPDCVWNFLDSVPANAPKGKRRLDLLMDRWIADKNIPQFTNPKSQSQVDLITADATPPKSINISLLSTRQTMLQQLGAEIQKMKRPLLELILVVRGLKQV
jgi:hypothetical protein